MSVVNNLKVKAMKKMYGVGWYTTRGSQLTEKDDQKPAKTARHHLNSGKNTFDTIVGFEISSGVRYLPTKRKDLVITKRLTGAEAH